MSAEPSTAPGLNPEGRQELLFLDGPEPLPPAALNPRTARMKARQQATIDRGHHPLNGLPLANNGHICGDCRHRYHKRRANTFPKCELGPITNGPGTDVRAWWPACQTWEALP